MAEWLLEPDITHVSSEVSFAEDCPPPADYTTTVFCSSPRYIELLELLDGQTAEVMRMMAVSSKRESFRIC